MRKMELVTSICDQTGLSRYVVKQVVDTCFEQIVDATRAGQTVILPGFGRFQQVPFRGGAPRLRYFAAKKTANAPSKVLPMTGS